MHPEIIKTIKSMDIVHLVLDPWSRRWRLFFWIQDNYEDCSELLYKYFMGAQLDEENNKVIITANFTEEEKKVLRKGLNELLFVYEYKE